MDTEKISGAVKQFNDDIAEAADGNYLAAIVAGGILTAAVLNKTVRGILVPVLLFRFLQKEAV